MNRRLQYLNLAGVILLAVLCVAQWSRDRHLNLTVNDLEKTRQAQVEQLADQNEKIAGLTSDLARFKEQFVQEHTSAVEAEKKWHAAETENDRLTLQCEQLKTSLTNWQGAVTERDNQLKTANERINEFADRLNGSIQRFNELTTNYNDVVARYNDLAQKSQGK